MGTIVITIQLATTLRQCYIILLLNCFRLQTWEVDSQLDILRSAKLSEGYSTSYICNLPAILVTSSVLPIIIIYIEAHSTWIMWYVGHDGLCENCNRLQFVVSHSQQAQLQRATKRECIYINAYNTWRVRQCRSTLYSLRKAVGLWYQGDAAPAALPSAIQTWTTNTSLSGPYASRNNP